MAGAEEGSIETAGTAVVLPPWRGPLSPDGARAATPSPPGNKMLASPAKKAAAAAAAEAAAVVAANAPSSARVPSSGSLQNNVEAARIESSMEAAAWVAAVTNTEAPRRPRSAKECEAVLQAWLQSGELLCELMNCVQPGVIKKIASSSMPFKQMENIAHYIEACNKLGVPAQDLFQTVDLFEGKDMRAVVRNLHSVGRVAQTLGSYHGPVLGAKLAERNERHFTQAQLDEAKAMPARWTNVGKSLTKLPVTSP